MSKHEIEERVGTTTERFRSVSFKSRTHGAYIQVYQRKGEAPCADLAFFNGDRDEEELEHFAALIARARAKVKEWT